MHRAGAALGRKVVSLNARCLQREMQRAQTRLLERKIEDLAVSSRTLSVLDFSWPPPESETTMLLAESGRSVSWIDPDLKNLDQVFGHLVRALLTITIGSAEGDVVEVSDQ